MAMQSSETPPSDDSELVDDDDFETAETLSPDAEDMGPADSSRDRDLLEAKFAEIEARAAQTQLSVTRNEYEGRVSLRIHFDDTSPGPGTRWHVGTIDRADEILAFAFEQYRTVPGYSAILRLDTGEIQARVRPLGLTPFVGPRYRRPFENGHVLSGEPQYPGRMIELSMTTGIVTRFLSLRPGPHDRPIPTVAFRGFDTPTVEAGKAILDEVGAALMFDLDLLYGVPLEIARADERSRRMVGGGSRSEMAPHFPRNAYDPEPLTLYMYGREAQGMPLLQFLAYYQAVEFYFPRYSEAELRRRLETLVKDPLFNPHQERDIGRLLHTAIGEGGRGFGSERDQLKATIRACVQADDVASFVGGDDDRAQFFADRRSSLTHCVIALRDQTTDVRDAAAARIYDIRCKIVHTKDGAGQSDVDLLLPYSAEARMLSSDIALMELIATRVIVASSRELRA